MIYHNSDPNLFIVFEAISLQSCYYEDIKKGDTIYVCMVPNGKYYLSKYGTPSTTNMGDVYETDAIEGIHFKRT